MSNRATNTKAKLALRRADYDANLTGKLGFHRPGSLNAHKQGAGAAKKR